MRQVLLINHLSDKGLALLPETDYQLVTEADNPDVILVRSADLHSKVWGEHLIAIGRAGTGVNNIPIDELSQKGVAVFNAPGANANAVKELVIGSMFMVARRLFSAAEFVKYLEAEESELAQLLEGGKKAFSGFELPGYKLGVVGLGAIGVKVANSALALGMEVYGYDPEISVQNAWHLSSDVKQEVSLNALLHTCDFISIHVPLTEKTRYLLNQDNLAFLNPEAVVMNFSRAEVVEEAPLLQALDKGKLGWYVTDFPTLANKNHPKVLALPHLGASTLQAEENASSQVIKQIKDFIELGSVTHSVNLPEVKVGSLPKGCSRLAIVNANHVGMIARISEVIGQLGINIVEMVNKSRGELAYTLVDIEGQANEVLVTKMLACEGVLSARFCGA